MAKSYCSTKRGVSTSWAQNQNMNTICHFFSGM